MTFLPTDHDVSSDKYIDLDYYGCDTCGCVQLKKLLDPNILYGVAHNMTYNTPIWKEHHSQFSNFIYTRKQSNEIIEVGGYSGVLAKHLTQKDKDIHYTILDMCDTDPMIENVKFINHNCETYNFQEDTIVVMSHVFEHLYEPSNFIKNLKENNVTNVFISIPDMTAQVENKGIPIVQQEHTFFCDYNDIVYLFSKEGYACDSSYSYKNHSLFFHFIKSDGVISNYKFNKNRVIDYYATYQHNDTVISSIKDIEEPFFIVPGGLYGQVIYYFLKNKKNLLGFLDNDPSKIGKRLYGTANYIFKMDEIKNYDNITLLIYNGPYTEEIISQLNEYNKNIKYIQV